MRRRHVSLAFLLGLLLAVPERANAWWEFIEPFSGPGRWTGPDIDARLMCFVDTSSRPENRAALDLLSKAQKAGPTQDAIRNAQSVEARLDIIKQWHEALPKWQDALDSWETRAGASAYKAAISSQSARDLRVRAERSLETLRTNLGKYEAARKSPETQEAFRKLQDQFEADFVVPAFRDAQQAIKSYETAISGLRSLVRFGMVVPLAAPGFILSACRLAETERRRAAIDLSMRFMWTKDERFVPDGEKIYLTTVEPAFSWSVFDDPNHDFVDYGIGAGLYWIASKRFPTVSGGFLEPLRLDFHAPSNAPKALRWFVVRTGLLVFPSGFAPEAFPLLSGAPNTRISRDVVKYIGFYIDTDALHKRKPAN